MLIAKGHKVLRILCNHASDDLFVNREAERKQKGDPGYHHTSILKHELLTPSQTVVRSNRCGDASFPHTSDIAAVSATS